MLVNTFDTLSVFSCTQHNIIGYATFGLLFLPISALALHN